MRRRSLLGPSPASVGEGGTQPLRAGRVRELQYPQNDSDHAFGVREDVVVPETKHTPALTFQPSGPAPVGLAVGMLSAIDLDDKPVKDTGEVQNERAERVLTPEFIAFQASPAQSRPHPALGVGHGGSQLKGLTIGHEGNDSITPLTLPKLRFGPLPLPFHGRGAEGGPSCA